MVILVPYDGSDPADRAVEYAVDAADGEAVVLFRVAEASDGMLEAGIDLVQEKLKKMQNKGSGGLSDETRELLNSADVEFDMEFAMGNPAREIVSFAEDNDVSQIVIGSHGRQGVSRILLGNVAETVVRRAPTTVTVVR